jgi:hypothetical protein
VFSGDIAAHGKEEEYEQARLLIVHINDAIQAHIGRAPRFVLVPGNHDLDYDYPGTKEEIRDLIIETATPERLKQPPMHEYCLAPQAPFRAFAGSLASTMQTDWVEDIAMTQTRTVGGVPLSLLLINTAPYSRRGVRRSPLWLPLDQVKETARALAPGTVSIAVMHHSYSYFGPETGQDLQRLLEQSCDVILTGHEHIADEYQKKRHSQEQNLYLAGGVLQNQDDPNPSTFNVLWITPEAQAFEGQRFDWSGARYEPATDTYRHKYHRLRQPLLQSFQLDDGFTATLEDLGTDLRHPRCRQLRLSTLFVYPDLQRLDVRRACSPTGTVRDKDVLGFVQENRRVLIAGAERAGKTSLAKQLFKDLRMAGLVPLLIGAQFRPAGPAASGDDDRLKMALDSLISETYGVGGPSAFWQTRIEERALVVDDFDRLTFGTGGRDLLLRYADARFGVIVLLAHPGIRLTDILDRPADDTLLWTFEHLDILECDAEMRFQLVSNWLRAGADAFADADEHPHSRVIRYCQTIDNIVGQGAIPSLPQYILMMLQQLESRGTIDINTGLYGALYEFIIRDVVRHAARDIPDLELKLTYLSGFAFYLHGRSKHFVPFRDFEAWHNSYCSEYNCRLDPRDMVLQFEALGVFRTAGSNYGFKYRYYYCFFLARHLANNIHDEATFDRVAELCRQLYNEDSAKTMLFLCHLSKHPRILDILLATARHHFASETEYDLAVSPAVLPAAAIRPSQLELPQVSQEDTRTEVLRHQDEASRPRGLVELTDDGDGTAADEILPLVNELNSAIQSIRICGQVVRNYYGGIRGETQLEFVRECYAVCLRMMTVLFSRLETDREQIAELLANILLTRHPAMGSDELDGRVRKSLQFIAVSVCYGLVKHTSSSVGLADLEPTFDLLLAREPEGASVQMLDLSTRLDYLDEFPEPALLALADKLADSGVAFEVLRVLVWEHFKMFETDFRIRQRACAKLDIRADQTALGNPLLSRPALHTDSQSPGPAARR